MLSASPSFQIYDSCGALVLRGGCGANAGEYGTQPNALITLYYYPPSLSSILSVIDRMLGVFINFTIPIYWPELYFVRSVLFRLSGSDNAAHFIGYTSILCIRSQCQF